MTTARSAYPITDEVLVGKVSALAGELGAWPSKRKIMRTCRVGRTRAAAALAALHAEGFDPAPAPHLHAVPDPAETQPEHTEEQPEPATDAPKGALDEPTDAATAAAQTGGDPQVTDAADAVKPRRARRVPRWPLLIIALGAFVSIWGGWIGLGRLTGFGRVQLLPGIADSVWIDSAITLPLGVEAYAAFAMWAWMAPPGAHVSDRARGFARTSALAALGLGALGQIAYHLMSAAEMDAAPWPIVALVACVPVGVLGAGAALIHLLHEEG